jgi:hypothetical protein
MLYMALKGQWENDHCARINGQLRNALLHGELF